MAVSRMSSGSGSWYRTVCALFAIALDIIRNCARPRMQLRICMNSCRTCSRVRRRGERMGCEGEERWGLALVLTVLFQLAPERAFRFRRWSCRSQ